MNTTLGIWSPGADSENSRAPKQPLSFQSLGSDFLPPRRPGCRLEAGGAVTAVPQMVPYKRLHRPGAHSPELAGQLVTQSCWTPLRPPHSSFSPVEASVLKILPAAGPSSPFWNPHKTLLADICLSLSHPSPHLGPVRA